MENKNQAKEEKMRLKFVTILAIFLLLLSLVSLGVALLKPVPTETSSVIGKVTVNVIGGVIAPHESAAPSTMSGKVILNVISTK